MSEDKNDIYKTLLNEISSLTPDNINSGNQLYVDVLNTAVTKNDIKNIALSGPYGAGKSTILKAFTKANKEQYKFKNISLASFDGSVINLL